MGRIFEQRLHPVAEFLTDSIGTAGVYKHDVIGEQSAYTSKVLGVEVVWPLPQRRLDRRSILRWIVLIALHLHAAGDQAEGQYAAGDPPDRS